MRKKKKKKLALNLHRFLRHDEKGSSGVFVAPKKLPQTVGNVQSIIHRGVAVSAVF